MRDVIPSMRARGGGSIINVSSIWGNAAVAGAHAYHATQGALRNMSKSAAITYAKDIIRSRRTTRSRCLRTRITVSPAVAVCA